MRSSLHLRKEQRECLRTRELSTHESSTIYAVCAKMCARSGDYFLRATVSELLRRNRNAIGIRNAAGGTRSGLLPTVRVPRSGSRIPTLILFLSVTPHASL